jgi:hypothetical protein
MLASVPSPWAQEQLVLPVRASAQRWLASEARALLTRLDRVKPFVLQETMVAAAAPSLAAQTAIESYLADGRRRLRRMVKEFLRWLKSNQGQSASPSEAQRRFAYLRMRFNDVLSQFDIFADVMTQRSEYETGVWLSGLDALAADALKLPGRYFDPPPVVCYLDRGQGAAIRRARTRLPGGGENPVAVVRVPRERMVSNGVASSLVHEVGHQGAVLLGLITSLRRAIAQVQPRTNGHGPVYSLFSRWISEILADFWSVSRLGVGSTLGLMGVVSLPRAFVFRVGLDDPHPIPWIRVKLSCAMGKSLYPDPQWDKVAEMWEAYYPLDTAKRQLFTAIESSIPSFVALLVNHRPASLHGRSLGEVMAFSDRTPERLRMLHRTWGNNLERMRRAKPSLVFAVIGQARAGGLITPEAEGPLLIELLTYWAKRNTLNMSAICVQRSRAPAVALAA